MSNPLLGTYTWTYNNGNFPVTLRPYGIFYCGKHQANAKYEIVDNNKVIVDWSKYGRYEFIASTTTSGCLEGSLIGTPSSWRRMQFVQPLSNIELLLLGEGGGSVWQWDYEGGSFEVEFVCDSLNHFVCKSYPSHSHWTLENNNQIAVDWGKYGTYDLIIDPESKTMSGCYRGHPESWRRCKFIRGLGQESFLSTGCGHDHDHSAHVHGPNCNH